jgi:hypothetical protein
MLKAKLALPDKSTSGRRISTINRQTPSFSPNGEASAHRLSGARFFISRQKAERVNT